LAHSYISKFATKLQQNCLPILTDFLTRRNILANVQCLLLALRHPLKQSCHWSIAWSMKLYWLLTMYQSHAASAHWRPSLVSDKHVPACRFQSVSPDCCTGVVFMQPGPKLDGAYYCDVSVLKQLLPDSCQAAGDFTFQCTTRAQEHWAAVTRLRTSHQTWPPNRPDLSSLNYRLLRVIQECVFRNSKGCQTSLMSCGVVINRMIFY